MSAAMLALAMAAGPAAPAKVRLPVPLQGVHRILVLGDSITYGGGYVVTLDGWLFRQFPGRRFEVINVGLPSENLSGLTEPGHAGGAFPRPDLHERLARVLDQTKPDLVLASYGVNDGIYYPFAEERFAKYRAGIEWLRTKVLATGARLWLITPMPFDPQPIRSSVLPAGLSEYRSPYEGYDSVLARYSEWLMSHRKAGWHVIDVHTPLDAVLADRRRADPAFALAPDGIHLNAEGHRLVAREILRAWGVRDDALPTLAEPSTPADKQFWGLVEQRQQMLKDAWLTATRHTRPGMPQGLPLDEANRRAETLATEICAIVAAPPAVAFPGAVSDYHGFEQHELTVDGCKAIVVAPHVARAGRPWIWRAEFFDHRPELDVALLGRGFHLAYIEVGNTFGAPSAMRHWDVFYHQLTATYGLSPKPVLEGLSRGGLYIYNWAAANPRCVSVLYGDNPVCDFKSWPGGKGHGPGSPDDWRKLISDYGFATEAEALAYRKNPVDNLAPLARAHVPIIHLAADADEVVPYEENTVILRQRYEKLGGEIRVIVKHGGKHHPHGLDDPTPLVEFIEAHLQPARK